VSSESNAVADKVVENDIDSDDDVIMDDVMNFDDVDENDDGLSHVSFDNIESSAVDMYNKGKEKQFLQKKEFQRAVVLSAKLAIKQYYESREISKEQYKDIMKKAVNKVCHGDKNQEVNDVKIRRLIRRYVENYREKNVRNKDKMRDLLLADPSSSSSHHKKSSKSRRRSKSSKAEVTSSTNTHWDMPTSGGWNYNDETLTRGGSGKPDSSVESFNIDTTLTSSSRSPLPLLPLPAHPLGLPLMSAKSIKISLPEIQLPPPPPPPRPAHMK